MPLIREDQALITVSVGGVPYGTAWNEAEGGNLEQDDAKARPGGMGMEQSAGGPASRSDLSVRINMDDIVAGWIPTHEAACNNVTEVVVGIAWLGPDRLPLGTRLTRRGTLKAVNPPDLGGGADVGLYELVVSCHQQ